jgi:hypothetical protein
MVTRAEKTTLAQVLDRLTARAVLADVPAPVVDEALRATTRALCMPVAAPATALVRRRAEAYFSAVIRRRTVRGEAGPRATARMIASAVVEDLRETGRDGSAIWHELERGWCERLPEDVLEEYRLRLCG